METAPQCQSDEPSDLRWFSEPHDSVYGTWQSQAVTHPLMNRARRRLPSVIEQISMSESRIPYIIVKCLENKGFVSLGLKKVLIFEQPTFC